jgi:hypothetical protein
LTKIALHTKAGFPFLTFFVAMGLRIVLAFLNTEANDDHITVIRWIAERHSLPAREDCWSCYHLKFYHILAAGIYSLFGAREGIIAVQLFNVVLGFFILLLSWKFIDRQAISSQWKKFSFALLALNPCLIGINIQITNDTLEILSGVSATYFFCLFVQEKKPRYGALVILSLLVAAFTKATGLVLMAVVALLLLLWILPEKSAAIRKAYLVFLACLALAFLFIFPSAGYYSYYRKYNTLPTTAFQWDPPRAAFFEKTEIGHPGVRSVAECFFTFPIIGMLREPMINNELTGYPLHRTSLWSQLYGRTVFMHFDYWPPGWQSHDRLLLWVGRLLILSGLFPLLILIWGFLVSLWDVVRLAAKRTAESESLVHVAFAAALLAGVISYSYDLREYSAMKSIYIFPALISFVYFFVRGLSIMGKKGLMKGFLVFDLSALIGLSVCDVVYLIWQLQHQAQG